MTLLTALEIAGNYPDNILITSFKDENDLYGGWMYMTRNGNIHKAMLDFKGHFQTAEEAENYLHEISKECVKNYKDK